MRHPRILWKACVLVLCLGAGFIVQRGKVSNQLRRAEAGAEPTGNPSLSYGNLPLSFEINQGQTDKNVKFLSHGRGYGLFLTGDEAVLTLRGQSSVVRGLASSQSRIHNLLRGIPNPEARKPNAVLRMRLVGANANAAVTGGDELTGKVNYFIGNDPKRWRTNLPTYAQIRYRNIYPGIDLVYHGNQAGELEYDFVVAAGGDPNQVKLSFPGADGMWVDGTSGDLVLRVGGGEVRMHKPAVYQPSLAAASLPPSQSVVAASGVDVRHHSVATSLDGTFVLASNRQVAFRVARYDPRRALVIDPVLSYSSYLGGNAYGYGIAVDGTGSAYVTGFTSSSSFPTVDPFQATNHGGSGNDDAFVTKLNATGSALVYSTYLGGSGDDVGYGIAVDSSGNAYVTGSTYSTDFPTAEPLQATNGGDADGFVTKLNATGSALVYSTYLGGISFDTGHAIAVDSSGNAYVTGWTYSTNFPTVAPFQATCGSCTSNYTDVFVAKLNAAGSALVYSTYLGGNLMDYGYGIAVDATGDAYVTGTTQSSDFPTANPFQATCPLCGPSGNYNSFVTKVNPTGSALVYSTYLGGSGGDQGYGIAVDASGSAYVTGITASADFPTANPLQASYGGEYDAFVTKFNTAGLALVYSTYLGGSNFDNGYGIAVDSSGNAYVSGCTNSTDFPTVDPLQATCVGCTPSEALSGDAFVAKLNAAGSTLVYSTYLGIGSVAYDYGMAVDSADNAYVTGTTQSTVPFVAKISGTTGTAPAADISTTSVTFAGQMVGTTSPGQPVTLSNTGSAPLTISSIGISGNFGQTNNCGGSVAASGSCTINVTFTPGAGGPLTGSLTITDNNSGVAGSTQTVSLIGTGEDFTFATPSGSSASATASPGQTATYTLSVGGEGGFSQAVNFTCAGAPSESSCTVSPNPLTVGSSATNVTVTVTTTAASVSPPRNLPLVKPHTSGPQALLMLAVLLSGLALRIWSWKQFGAWRRRVPFPLGAALLLALVMAACGGGGGSGGGGRTNPGTSAGTYTLTVTGTVGSGSTALSHNVTLTLIVS